MGVVEGAASSRAGFGIVEQHEAPPVHRSPMQLVLLWFKNVFKAMGEKPT
jgi:hypothetical protein